MTLSLMGDGLTAGAFSSCTRRAVAVASLRCAAAAADLCIGKPGFACFVECKSGPEKKLTKEQIRVKNNWTGPYIVAHSLEDARQQLRAYA